MKIWFHIIKFDVKTPLFPLPKLENEKNLVESWCKGGGMCKNCIFFPQQHEKTFFVKSHTQVWEY